LSQLNPRRSHGCDTGGAPDAQEDRRPTMTRVLKTAEEIEALLLQDVRQQRHCDKVEAIRIRPCEPCDDSNGANWKVASVDPGQASREFAGAAVMTAMGRWQCEVSALPWE
jgi:hypothetical protein